MGLAWPAALVNVTRARFQLENVSRGGGAAMNGSEQRVYNPDQRWIASITVPIRNKEQVFAFRALMARADGSAGIIDVPAFEKHRANWPVDAYGRKLSPKFTRRRELDGTIYEDPAIPTASAITATVSGAHAIRATTLAISLTQGSPLHYGQYVSIAGHLYILRWPVSTVGSVYTFEIRPPLRVAAAAGATVEVANPTCEMRLASDDQTGLDLDLLKFAEPSLSFIEYF
jgi:hypothetical protein